MTPKYHPDLNLPLRNVVCTIWTDDDLAHLLVDRLNIHLPLRDVAYKIWTNDDLDHLDLTLPLKYVVHRIWTDHTKKKSRSSRSYSAV